MVGEEKKSPEHTVLRQPRQPIHKPCLGLHKEHETTNVQDTVKGKIREATSKVIVRSAYFQHKQVEKNVCDEKQDCLSPGSVIAISDSDLCGNHLKNKVQGLQDTVAGKTREATRKVVVRSAYFQHKQVEKNVCNENQDHLSSGIVIEDRKKAISDCDLCNNHLKNRDLKRKISPNDNGQNEILQPRQTNCSSLPHNGCSDHNVDGPFTENKTEEETFGTNISHLGKYSEIAEKSMERFVSVISSFRCTSGSRVSGLRAPLKDVRNTFDNRPKTVDFGQYAYVPKQTKTRRIAPGN